jgi:hypothetical protein
MGRLRFVTLSVLVVSLAACVRAPPRAPEVPPPVPSPPSAPAAPPAPPAPLPGGASPPPPAVNLSGFPPEYRRGYGDGCASARSGGTAKSQGSGQYAMGWSDGYRYCDRTRR